ncbi:MAG: hypothetical protein KY475_14565 [Planctomycetes bacterium]|nr:hypothetical protein [Planctomycetota bacterium]
MSSSKRQQRRLSIRGHIERLEDRQLLAIWNVPGDYPTIQSAHDNIPLKDTIEIGAGTFIENLAWTRDVHLQGAGPERSTIKGSLSVKAPVLKVEAVDSLFRDVAFAEGMNGGAEIVDGSPTFLNTWFIDNRRETRGTAIDVTGDSNPKILGGLAKGNRHYQGEGHIGGFGTIYYDGGSQGLIAWMEIRENDAWHSGGCMTLATTVVVHGVVCDSNSGDYAGGIRITGGAPTVEHSLIVKNRHDFLPGYSAGISIAGGTPRIRFNTIAGNGLNGVFVDGSASVEVVGNIITNSDGAGIAAYADVILSRNNVWGNQENYQGPKAQPDEHSISSDPLLDNDYVPAVTSPVIDAGPPSVLDLDGTPSDMGYTGGRGVSGSLPYRVDTVIADNTIEQRLYKDGFHFDSLIKTPNGALVSRPHPDLEDINGWGSSEYWTVYIAGGAPGRSQFTDVIATSSGIYVSARGEVTTSSGAFGGWRTIRTLVYDAGTQKVAGHGVLEVSLDGTLEEAGGDLNVFFVASNRLINVPSQEGGIVNTGDIERVDVSYAREGSDGDFTWRPEERPAHFPNDTSGYLSVDAIGTTNVVDTKALGFDFQIAKARKPTFSLAMAGRSNERLGVGLDFDETRSQDPFEDNVGIVGLVFKGSTDSKILRFDIKVAAEVPPNPTRIETTTTPLTYTENDPAVPIDRGLLLTPGDNAGPSARFTATVAIGGGFAAGEDELGFSDTARIEGVLSGTGDTLTLSVKSGQTATVADFEGALRRMTYRNTSEDPSTIQRTVTFAFNDGVASTNVATRTIVVASMNDAPSEIVLSNASVAENEVGAVVGDLTARDPEAGDRHTFTISDDRFEALGGRLKLKDGVSLDYESAATVSLDVIATDSGTPAKSFTQALTVTVTDVNELPFITNIGDQNITEDAVTGTLAFTISDPEAAAEDVTVVAASTNPGLSPASSFAFGGSGTDRTLVITPAVNQFGSATITLAVTDGDGLTATETFELVVDPVNDAPTFSLAGHQTVNEDAGEQIVEGFLTAASAGPANETDQTLSLVVSNDNSDLFVSQPAIDLATGRLTYSSGANTHGMATVTVTLTDDGGGDDRTERTFIVTVNAVNDAPTSIAPTAGTVNENAPGAVIATLTVTDPDAGDTHSLAVSDDRFEIVAGVLKLKDSISLDFETEATETVQITATDSGDPVLAYSQAFAVRVNDVVDPQHPWHNAEFPWDVDDNESVTINDVLEIVLVLREHGNPYLLPLAGGSPPYVDVNKDGLVSIGDLLEVVQRLRQEQSAQVFKSEGEQSPYNSAAEFAGLGIPFQGIHLLSKIEQFRRFAERRGSEQPQREVLDAFAERNKSRAIVLARDERAHATDAVARKELASLEEVFAVIAPDLAHAWRIRP